MEKLLYAAVGLGLQALDGCVEAQPLVALADIIAGLLEAL